MALYFLYRRSFFIFTFTLLTSTLSHFVGSISAEDLYRGGNPYAPAGTTAPGSVLKLMIDEPVLIDYEVTNLADTTTVVKIVPDKQITSFLPPANSDKNVAEKDNMRIRTRGRITLAMGVTVVRVENGQVVFQGVKRLAPEAGDVAENVQVQGRVNLLDISSRRVIRSQDVADLVVMIRGKREVRSTNYPVKQKPGTNPGDPAKPAAELSDDEKQRLLMEYINRVIGETNRP